MQSLSWLARTYWEEMRRTIRERTSCSPTSASRLPRPHRQYKVTPDDLIITEKLSGVDVNDRIRLNKVLLLGNKTETIIGRPAVEGASVIAVVEEQFLDGKVLVFKKRRRKNSRRLNGHRQPLTSLRVVDIEEGL